RCHPGEANSAEAFIDQSRCSRLETRRARPDSGTCPTCFGPPGCSPAEPGPEVRSASDDSRLALNRRQPPGCAQRAQSRWKTRKSQPELDSGAIIEASAPLFGLGLQISRRRSRGGHTKTTGRECRPRKLKLARYVSLSVANRSLGRRRKMAAKAIWAS